MHKELDRISGDYIQQGRSGNFRGHCPRGSLGILGAGLPAGLVELARSQRRKYSGREDRKAENMQPSRALLRMRDLSPRRMRVQS